MARKKAARGAPGETGVSEDGIPWQVPERRPGAGERFRRWLSLAPATAPDETMPEGAEFVPARTPQEVLQRCARRYGDNIAGLLDADETLTGFVDLGLDQHVPRPPQPGLDQPEPAARWMGGDWDSTAGQLVTSIDGVGPRNQKSLTVLYRGLLWIRTSRRVLILAGNMETPAASGGEYPLDQVGLRPGWAPWTAPDGIDRHLIGRAPGRVLARGAGDTGGGSPYRVDIAFADGSWLGVTGLTTRVPGGTVGYPDRDLLAELAGPPIIPNG